MAAMPQPPRFAGGVACVRPSLSYWRVQDDIRHLDRPWSLDKIAMLVDGEVEIDGELHVGMSAYEMRMAAQSSSSDFADPIIEAAQLDRSIQSGILRDHKVRIAMLLRTRGGFDEHEIEEMLDSDRPGYALLARGAELVRRHERGRRSQLLRVRAHNGQSDAPVCWRCLKAEVPRPGDWCGCTDKEWKGERRSKTGPGAAYDPTAQPDPSEMTDEERQAEIDRLVATQEKGPIPGGEWYRKKVQPVGGTMYDPDDLRRSDRAYKRGRSEGAPTTPTEQVPSA